MPRFAIDLTACWRARTGMQTVSLELARALVADRGEDEYTLLCSRERPAGLAGIDAEAVLSPYRHELANKLRWLPAVEGQLACDAILYPYWPSPPRRRRGSPPAVIFVHDLAFRLRHHEVPWQQRAYLGTTLGPALKGASAVLVPTDTTRRDLLDCYPIRGLAGRVRVVPEGLPRRVAAGPLPAGLQPGFLLAVGTIEPRKNYPRLLAAYRDLRARMDDAPPLVIAGMPGWAYGDTLEQIASTPGVRHLGHVDEPTLSALYAGAAVLAFASLYEGFGLPLLEAMASGLPAVIGNAGSLPEVAGGAAIEVDPLDPGAISRALERVITDSDVRRGMVERGRTRAASYTWERAAEVTRAALHDSVG